MLSLSSLRPYMPDIPMHPSAILFMSTNDRFVSLAWQCGFASASSALEQQKQQHEDEVLHALVLARGARRRTRQSAGVPFRSAEAQLMSANGEGHIDRLATAVIFQKAR